MDRHETVTCDDIDFSPLLVPNIKFAVRCETEEEVRQFFTAIAAKFPDKESQIRPTNLMWHNDNDGRGGGRVYFPDLNYAEHDPIMHGDLKFAIDYGYTVVYYRDLVIQKLIEESDMSFDILFGS